MAATLHLLCAGAAQGLVKALQPRLLAEAGAEIAGRFGAVGAMKEALLAGEPCDLMIVTDKMVGELVEAGCAARRHPRAARPRAHRHRRAPRRAASRCLDARGTEGGVAGGRRDLLPRRGALDRRHPLRGRDARARHPRSAASRAFAPFRTAPRRCANSRRSDAPRLIGCTQVTEIKYTEGVELVAPLPARFELATVYTAAVSATRGRAGIGSALHRDARRRRRARAARGRRLRGLTGDTPCNDGTLIAALPAGAGLAGGTRAGLPGAPDPLHRAGGGRRRQRPGRPHRHRTLGQAAGPDLRGREHRRRRRRDRLPDHGQGRARRLHAAAGLCGHARHQPGHAQQAAVRRDQGLHAGRA